MHELRRRKIPVSTWTGVGAGAGWGLCRGTLKDQPIQEGHDEQDDCKG